jgi:hypothetical protein
VPDSVIHNLRLWYLLDARGQRARVSASSRTLGQIARVSLPSGSQVDKRVLTIEFKRIVLGLSTILTLCTLSTIGSVTASVVILKRKGASPLHPYLSRDPTPSDHQV